MHTSSLSADALARDVAECFPEMAQIARIQWSMSQLRSPAGTCFLAALDDAVQAFEDFEPNAYSRLCQAIALRIAILMREGSTSVMFCGVEFGGLEYLSVPSYAETGAG